MVASLTSSTSLPSLEQLEASIASPLPESWVDELFTDIAETQVKKQTSKTKKPRQTKATKKSSFDKVAASALDLDRDDRFKLIEMLQQFNDMEIAELEENEREKLMQKEAKTRKSRKGRGCRVESKMINGCGPYRYFRWWLGGTYKSTYIGKI